MISLADVRYWHLADIATQSPDVRYWGGVNYSLVIYLKTVKALGLTVPLAISGLPTRGLKIRLTK